MVAERDTGIGVIGRVPWGTHFCLFYETRGDLASVLVPFFEVGLKNNEYCACVTSEPLYDGVFKKAMRDAVPGFDEYLDKGHIEFIPYNEWYYEDGNFNLKKAFNGWLKKLQVALANGYDGMRVTGNISWLKRENWEEFIDYENEVNSTIGNSKMLAICTYPLDACDASGIVGAVSAHQFALIKYNGEFKLIENSELKETKKRLRESEEKYRILADSSQAGIILIQGEEIVYINQALADIGGYTVEECLNKNFLDFLHPDFMELLQQRGFAAQQNRKIIQPRYECKIIRKDRNKRWLDFSPGLTMYNGLPALIITAIDITERKQAEEALMESEEKFHKLADSANVGILLVQDEDIIYINQALAALAGYTVEECKHLKYWDVMTQENKDYIRWAGNARQHGWVGPSRSELKLIGKDGREIWLDCSWADPLIGGRPAVIVICVDITERKRTDEELKTAKMQAELYLDLMGHDINNMHQVAMGYLELARELPPGDDQAKFVDKSMEVLQRSTKLIGNVRKLQKFRDGLFQAGDIDICRTLLDIQSEYVAVPDKKIILNLNGHEKCFVRANELLHDVFANLVNNAVKHTREGTEIVVDLDVIDDNGKHFYRVAVEDNGPGIPDESKESIFNRMHMGSSRGMGLGLYIVRTLVNSYGGRVWAEDRIKGDHTKGARFVVLLPTIK